MRREPGRLAVLRLARSLAVVIMPRCAAWASASAFCFLFSMRFVSCLQMTAAPTQPTSPLARPVTALPGVGSERAAQMARLGISTIEDLLLHRPHRYEDRNRFRPIVQVRLGEAVT